MIKNQWYAILSSKEICRGRLTAVKRLGMDLCFFRNALGEVGCLLDKCPHRGAALSSGVQKKDHVVCPFHGLEFDKTGKCKLIPANGKMATVENRFNATDFLIKEAHDIVYLWFGEKEQVTDTLPFFDDSINGQYVYSQMTDLWQAHYSRCIENQLDVIHIPFVHYNTIGRGNKTLVNGPALEQCNQTITLTANNSIDTGQSPKQAHECLINPARNIQFMFPNVWQNCITEKIKVIIFFVPIDDESTLFYIRFYTNLFPFRFFNRVLAQIGKVLNRIIERQDKQYVETQKPKISALACGENLLKGDDPIIMYRKMRDALQGKSLNS